MATISAPKFALSFNLLPLRRILELACLVSFAVDWLILTLRPAPGNSERCINFLQQMSDRSIVLLFGVALTIYGT
ncbi:MAG TPA: hypothetical protein V6C65_11050 [Allocoleopsis sp.]